MSRSSSPSIVIRFIWMLFIGWWLAGIFYIIGAILTLLIITAPLGMIVISKLGMAFSLYSENNSSSYNPNEPFLLRFIYFIFFGWWVGAIAYVIGVLAGVTIIGLPLTFYIFNRMGKIMTLGT